MHLGGGIWGTIACGLFRTSSSLFYGGDLRFLGVQVMGALVLSVWSLVMMGIVFAVLSYFKIFRVPEIDEIGILSRPV